MISAKTDTSKLEYKLNRFINRLNPMAITAVAESLYHINDKAMENLNIGLRWGHSVDGSQTIESSKVIETQIQGNRVVGSLTYTSPHASFIEYGGFYKYSRDSELTSMLVGKQEGNIAYYTHDIVVNYPGKFFLTSAVITEKNIVREILEGYMSNLVNEFNLG